MYVHSLHNNTPIFRVMSPDFPKFFSGKKILFRCILILFSALPSTVVHAYPNELSISYSTSDSLELTYAVGITIKGSASITPFECKNTIQKIIDTSSDVQSHRLLNALPITSTKKRTIHYQQHEHSIVFTPMALDFSILNFDCGGIGINKDFRKALKAETYPNLLISPIELSFDPAFPNQYQSLVTISLAGKDNTIPLELFTLFPESRIASNQKQSHRYIFAAEKKLLMTDFNIEPPRPLFGLIQVKNELVIELMILIENRSTL
jgi:hypothetical protein